MLEKSETFFGKLPLMVFLALVVIGFAGCQSPPDPVFPDPAKLSQAATNVIHTESIILREGDILKVTFPSSPSLNTPNIPIMRDGTITLPTVGVVHAAGKTRIQLQEELIKLYSTQIESKQITVELVTDVFPIFVTGAVLRPGKVMADHPMTALQAVMEAGGPDYARANLKSVTILRRENGHVVHYGVNLKDVMSGSADDQFYMKPDDIIYVRERFNWF